MARVCLSVLSAVMFFHTPVSAQEPGIELLGGAGYVYDSGEGPSVPAVSIGVLGWITPEWGLGVRLTHGLTDDHFNPPIEAGDRTFFGPGDLRMWSVTSQWRASARGTEVNLGLGVAGHGYRYEQLITGIRTGRDDEIVPLQPQLSRERSGIGLIAFELFVGRHLVGPLYLKGGFTYGWSGDIRPFQPGVVFALKP